MEASDSPEFVARLNDLLRGEGLGPLSPEETEKFSRYLSLILRWNARTNLTAVRDEEGILSRHFVECIRVATALPEGVGTLLDFGSGAGLPGIPIAVCRPEIAVTLAESRGKKAAFLLEVVRVLGLTAKVHSGRAEELRTQFHCVALRAVDKMPDAIRAAVDLVSREGWLAVMTTRADIGAIEVNAGEQFKWGERIALPGSDLRILALGQKTDSDHSTSSIIPH